MIKACLNIVVHKKRVLKISFLATSLGAFVIIYAIGRLYEGTSTSESSSVSRVYPNDKATNCTMYGSRSKNPFLIYKKFKI